MSDYTSLFNSIKQQNNTLLEAKRDLTDNYSIDDQKVYYQLQQLQFIKNIINYLVYIYYALVIVVIYILLFRQKDLNRYIKIFIVLCFVMYPFIIGPLEMYLYNSSGFLSAIINGNVYKNNY